MVQNTGMKSRFALRLLAIATLAAPLPGCAEFPNLDRTITPEMEARDYPALVPIEPILAQVDSSNDTAAQTESQLLARVARLRVRAARLRGSVLSGRERLKLAEGMK